MLRSLMVAAAFALSADVTFAADSLTEVKVALGWLRNAQYTALYVADAKGYFKEEGLKLTLLDGGPGKSPVSTVGAGQADVGITGGTFIFAARVAPDPVDVVAIGAIRQRTTYVYITLAKPTDPEPTPKDMEGKTVGIQTDGEIFLKSIAAKNKVDMSKVKIKIVQGGLEPLLVGAVDFISGHIHNQPYQFEVEAAKPDARENIKGRTWKVIRLSDYGVPSYNDLIFATNTFLKERPEVARKFLKAVARGLQLMQSDPDGAAKIAASYDGELDPLKQVQWSLKIQNDFDVSNDTREHGFLWMRPEVWQEQMAFYHDNGQLARVLPPGEVMTTAFLSDVRSK
jgi:NitT/TauT family transport system substrate-binding protein